MLHYYINRTRLGCSSAQLLSSALVSSVFSGMVRLEHVHHTWICQCGSITQVLRLVVRQRQLPQHAAHDFAAARLRQPRRPVDLVGRREGANDLSHLLLELHLERVVIGLPLIQCDVAPDAFAFHLVWKAHHRGFRHFAVRHQGRFHLCGANAVPADVDDVVHAAGEPIEAVLVALAAISSEVVAIELGEVGLLKSRMVAIDCAHHTGHWPLQHQAPRAFAAQLLAVLVQNGRLHAEERQAG
mmetsp:Transcript_48119/g.104911  ORF Transcript_48119/g.104911 Transcript_48119/m.104911 type:complete len:242 (+) Transcript_48119:241-966(+)